VADRRELFNDLTSDIVDIRKNMRQMAEFFKKSEPMDLPEKCRAYFSELVPLLGHVRKHVDDLESKMPDGMWPLPKYKEMLFIC
jgi:glutamine synthetase